MEAKKRDDQLQAVWFAAGTAVFMAVFQRAVLVSIVQQWRIWGFLALNLLLLAILFTSTSPISSPVTSESGQESKEMAETKSEEKKRRKPSASTCRARTPVMTSDYAEKEVGIVDRQLKLLKSETKMEDNLIRVSADEDDSSKNQTQQLSKEELNQRVEAFIAMFRQHLVSDAKGRSCRPKRRAVRGREFAAKNF